MKALGAGFFAGGVLTQNWLAAGIGGVVFVVFAAKDAFNKTFESG